MNILKQQVIIPNSVSIFDRFF